MKESKDEMKVNKRNLFLQLIWIIGIISLFLYFAVGKSVFDSVSDYLVNLLCTAVIVIFITFILFLIAVVTKSETLRNALTRGLCSLGIIFFPLFYKKFEDIIKSIDEAPEHQPTATLKMRNQRTGKNGENMVYKYLKYKNPHCEFLPMSKTLADNDGGGGNDRVGYDFEAIHPNGHIFRIEVKSTKSLPISEFNLTNNEISALREAEQRPDMSYHIFRLFQVDNSQTLDTDDFDNLHFFVYNEDQIELMIKYGYKKKWGYQIGEQLVPQNVRKRHGFPYMCKR